MASYLRGAEAVQGQGHALRSPRLCSPARLSSLAFSAVVTLTNIYTMLPWLPEPDSLAAIPARLYSSKGLLGGAKLVALLLL